MRAWLLRNLDGHGCMTPGPGWADGNISFPLIGPSVATYPLITCIGPLLVDQCAMRERSFVAMFILYICIATHRLYVHMTSAVHPTPTYDAAPRIIKTISDLNYRSTPEYLWASCVLIWVVPCAMGRRPEEEPSAFPWSRLEVDA